MKQRETSFIFRFLFVGLLCLGFAGSISAAERITYIHTDALGSPVAATDASGTVIWRESYEPYGERIKKEPAASANSRWFTGHPLDDETGLIYAGARYYDPVVGRFMGVDPVSVTEKSPHSFNRYSYGNNNPYRYVDPDGRFPIDTVWDAGNVVYDVVTGNWGDLAADLAATAIPYVPAGVTKLRHVGDAAKAGGAAPATVSHVPKVGSAGGPGAGKNFRQSTKEGARERSGNTCVFCGRETTKAPGPNQSNIDHAVPKSRGGNNTPDNAQNTCRDCNLRKGARTSGEFLRR